MTRVAPPAGKVRWGVLGAARIATRKVIPAIQRSSFCEVTAVASRQPDRARESAAALGIPKWYGTYEELLADPDIEAVYNPLPNHLHVRWTARAAEAGKGVLCEKPIALTAADAEQVLEVRNRTGVLIQEAFMVRTHPQWVATLGMVRAGRIGQVRAMSGFFSYFNVDTENIRNVAEFGGGGLMDIGCYLVNTARMIFERQPHRVAAAMERDPVMRIDRLTSLILDFGNAHAIGTCSTQLVPYQRIHILGTVGRIELEIPFNAPPDRPCRIKVDDGSDPFGASAGTIEIETSDQYTIQADLFARALREGRPAPYPLEDSVQNMRVIDALFRAAESGRWEVP
jgi:predicted dehydrogenase